MSVALLIRETWETLEIAPEWNDVELEVVNGPEVAADTFDDFLDQIDRDVELKFPDSTDRAADRALAQIESRVEVDIDAWAERLAQSAADLVD